MCCRQHKEKTGHRLVGWPWVGVGVGVGSLQLEELGREFGILFLPCWVTGCAAGRSVTIQGGTERPLIYTP